MRLAHITESQYFLPSSRRLKSTSRSICLVSAFLCSGLTVFFRYYMWLPATVWDVKACHHFFIIVIKIRPKPRPLSNLSETVCDIGGLIAAQDRRRLRHDRPEEMVRGYNINLHPMSILFWPFMPNVYAGKWCMETTWPRLIMRPSMGCVWRYARAWSELALIAQTIPGTYVTPPPNLLNSLCCLRSCTIAAVGSSGRIGQYHQGSPYLHLTVGSP